jgi:hypothetical protein
MDQRGQLEQRRQMLLKMRAGPEAPASLGFFLRGEVGCGAAPGLWWEPPISPRRCERRAW